MNQRIVFSRVACVALAFIAALPIMTCSGHADHIKLFLLAGQSNMDGRAPASGLPTSPVNLQQPQPDIQFYEGGNLRSLRPDSGTDFGPEITFGRAIADALPAESFGLIKYAAGGTDLNNSWDPSTGGTYSSFRNTVTNGLNALTNAGHTHEIVGMLWTQGERDAKTGRTTAQYTFDLDEFIADVRVRYGTDLPFYLSRLSSAQTNMTLAQRTQIRTAQDNVAASDPNAYLINTDGFGIKSDNLHFDAAGQISLGDAFAQVYLATLIAPGDTDGDGDIDDSDLGTSFANYTGPVGAAGARTSAQGDTDGDGDVDDSDLGTSFAGYTGPQSPANVPEPTSAAMILALGVCLRRRVRQLA